MSVGEFWEFCSQVGLHDTWPAGNRWGPPILKEEKDLCRGVSRPC